MQRAERRFPDRERRAVRTLTENNYLLGVGDEARLDARCFRWCSEKSFQAPITLQLIFAPASSFGGARPKAPSINQPGNLSIAKLPKETDDYSMESWEEIALRLASKAGIAPPTRTTLSHSMAFGGKAGARALYRRVAFNVLISDVGDHLRNHGFPWLGKAGWSLSPAHDLNPCQPTSRNGC